VDVYTRHLQDLWETDVLVIGSGSAGATAAITAARERVSVALIERYGFMGGISTQVLDTFYGFYTPGQTPRKVVGGVPDLVVDELSRRNKAMLRPNTYGAGQGITYDPEILKLVWERLTTDAGVRILYHTLVVDALVEGSCVIGVVAVNKCGFFRLKAKVVIDATTPD
jgi:flavin-dependent dehydrogenase